MAPEATTTPASVHILTAHASGVDAASSCGTPGLLGLVPDAKRLLGRVTADAPRDRVAPATFCNRTRAPRPQRRVWETPLDGQRP
jgi:hypothetical protein